MIGVGSRQRARSCVRAPRARLRARSAQAGTGTRIAAPPRRSLPCDLVGNRTGLTYPDGGAASHHYDEANRLTRLASPDDKAAYYAYDLTGLMLRKLLDNDSAAYFAYDTAGRLSYLRNVKSDGSPLSYVSQISRVC